MGEAKKRALSAKQALQCETATTPVCRCRCGGAAYGKARIASREELDQLEPGDPHRPEPMNKRAILSKLRRIKGYAMNAAVSQVPMSVGDREARGVRVIMAGALARVMGSWDTSPISRPHFGRNPLRERR